VTVTYQVTVTFLFANVYLNSLDQFVKHVLKCRFYVRYVDDFILLSTDKNELLQWQHRISQFLADHLQLAINPGAAKIDSIFNGVDFVGFVVRPFYLLCRRRVVSSAI
jgi:RNA-directed DNA polymerase